MDSRPIPVFPIGIIPITEEMQALLTGCKKTTYGVLFLPGEPPEVFGDRVGISGRGRLRDAAAHAARLFFTGQTAQFEFNLLGAVYERAHNLIEPLGCNAGQAPAVDLPHLA